MADRMWIISLNYDPELHRILGDVASRPLTTLTQSLFGKLATTC